MGKRHQWNEAPEAPDLPIDDPATWHHTRALVIVGAGAPVADIIRLIHEHPAYKLVGILDPAPGLRGSFIHEIPVLGWLGDLPRHVDSAIIGASLKPRGFDREAVYRMLLRRNIALPILAAVSSDLAEGVALQRGTVLLSQCRVEAGAVIGENCLVGARAIVGRYARVADHAAVPAGRTVDRQDAVEHPAAKPRTLGAVLAAETETLQDILARINWASMEIILVVDAAGRLLGTVTDGDIRRGLLAGIELRQPATLVMNRQPVTVPRGTPRAEMLRIMRAHSIRHLPVLDEQQRPVLLERMETLVDDLGGQDAVIMAGGLGTRLRPLTNDVPKPLLPVGDRPILDYILRGLHHSGLEDIVLSVNYKAEKIRDHVGDGHQYGLSVNYVSEQQRLGTAGALSLLNPRPCKPFLVMNGDLLTDLNFSKLLHFQRDGKYMLVMGVRQHQYQVPYGVVELSQERVVSLREKPWHRYFINAGIYVLRPDCLDYLTAGQYVDMPDLINALLADNQPVAAFPIVEYWRDIGRPEDLAAAAADQRRGSSGAPAMAVAEVPMEALA